MMQGLVKRTLKVNTGMSSWGGVRCHSSFRIQYAEPEAPVLYKSPFLSLSAIHPAPKDKQSLSLEA